MHNRTIQTRNKTDTKQQNWAALPVKRGFELRYKLYIVVYSRDIVTTSKTVYGHMQDFDFEMWYSIT